MPLQSYYLNTRVTVIDQGQITGRATIINAETGAWMGRVDPLDIELRWIPPEPPPAPDIIPPLPDADDPWQRDVTGQVYQQARYQHQYTLNMDPLRNRVWGDIFEQPRNDVMDPNDPIVFTED